MALNALYTGATGLSVNSSALDVVGNNLANLNTTGFKSQRTLFKDLVYQSLDAGSSSTSGTNGVGGVNASQVGFGVSVGSIDSVFLQGTTNPTGRTLDVAIQGAGFFVLRTPEGTAYSRAGAFNIDDAGFLVDPNTGARVQRTGTAGEPTATSPGYQVPGNFDIFAPLGLGAVGQPTANVLLQGNINNALATGENTITPIQVFDSQSGAQSLTLTFTKTAANTYTLTASIPGATVTVPPGSINFDTSGLLLSPATVDLAITGIPGAQPQTITVQLGTIGQANGLTQFGGASTARVGSQDGFGAGTLSGISFDTDGSVVGLFTNGQSITIAQLAIASFNNEGGLLRSGNNYFVSGAASGQPFIGTAATGGRGSIQGSALEGSNVDIAVEFSRLIIAQRGFQVNSRTISAANETLQELANIIR